MLRIQKGNSFTMLLPYDLETVTSNRYLTKQKVHGLPARWHTCNHALTYIHRSMHTREVCCDAEGLLPVHSQQWQHIDSRVTAIAVLPMQVDNDDIGLQRRCRPR